MAETQRLSVWGWFVRAFAGGVGAMFGVIAALMFVCVACYVVFAAGAMALSSLGGVSYSPPVVLDGSMNNPPMARTPDPAQFYGNPARTNPYPAASQAATYIAEEPGLAPYTDGPPGISTYTDTETE